jgi:hypothetical protein
MEVSGQLHTTTTGNPGTHGTEVGWAPELVWAFWRSEKYLAPAGNLTKDHLAHRLVTALTKLPDCTTSSSKWKWKQEKNKLRNFQLSSVQNV